MTENQESGKAQQSKQRRKVRISDILIFGVLLVIIAALGYTLMNKLSLKHAVDAARPVSEKTIAAIQARDGAAANKLGDKQFQAKNSAASLTKLFKAEQVATLKNPTLDRTMVYDSKKGRTVFFIYKYTALKVPFYVRTGISESAGQWKLTSLDGTLNESKLIIQ